MIKKVLFLIATGVLFAIPRLSAQSNSYSHGHEVVKEDVNMMELSNYEKLHPPVLVQKRVIDEEGEEMASRRIIPANPALVRTIHGEIMKIDGTADLVSGSGGGSHSAYMPVASPPADTFQAQVTDGTSIPPDTHGAVDGTYAVCAINSSVRIRNKTTHASVSNVTLDGFWGPTLLGGGGAFDPRVHYDAYTNHWIMVAVSVDGSMNNSRILVAISATGDPTGTWHKYAVVTDASNATWLDFPNVGYNSKWVTVTGNYFSNSSGGFTNAVIYAFDKAAITAGTGAPFTRIALSGGSGGFSICPAVTLDATEGSMFIMDVTNPGAGQLRLRKLTGTVAAPTLSGTLFNPATSTHWNNSPGVDFGPQSGTTNKLQVNDDRINNLTFRNGKLWCAHNIYLPASGTANRCAAMWWETDTSSTGGVIQNGVIDGGSAALMFAFPCISVNQNNDALMGFAYMSSGSHPSAAYAYRVNSDTISKMETPFIFRHGQATYYQTFGGSQNRWGDYSGTCVDPTNNLDFWTIQESVSTTNNWDTWWAKVVMCAYLTAPTAGSGPASPCVGSITTYSVAPVAGATSYTWTIPTGSGWSGTSTTNSLDLTIGTGTVTVTVAANNLCGPGSVYTFTVSAIAIPTVSIGASAAICAGATAATFTTTATGGPASYNWTVSGTGWSGTSSTSSLSATVGTGTGTITVSGTNACGTGPDFVYTVTPGTPPGAASTITGPTSAPCSGTLATYTTPLVSGATSYTWTVAGIGWSGSGTTNSIVVAVGTGTGTITVTPVNGCGSGTPFTLSGIIPGIAPVASFLESTHITTTFTNVTCTFTGSAPGGTTYAWTFAGGTPPTSTSPGPVTAQWATAGTYTVTLVVTNSGCSATIFDTVHVNTSLETAQITPVSSVDVSILPNPNRGAFEIIFSQPVNGPVTVKIYDMEGRVVYNDESSSLSNNRMPVDTHNLATGNYNAIISADGAVINKKITIAR